MTIDTKIVGCVTGKTAEECKKEILKASQNGASLVELRIDYLSNPKDLVVIIQKSSLPVIATFRRSGNGGLFEGDEKFRIQILKDAIKAGAKYIDIEIDTDQTHIDEIKSLAKKSRCQVIISQHFFNATPNFEILKTYMRAAAKIADIVKIVTTAKRMEDCQIILNLISIAKSENIRIVAFAMGKAGQITRGLDIVYGAEWTYAYIEKSTASGQLSIEYMRETLRMLYGDN